MKGLRFQKRIRILPFLWINLSKSGVSFTVGGRNLKLNFGKKGAVASVNVPGTGVSRKSLSRKSTAKSS
ncbi:DUF4236 domain-containing protein (plasmid) [Photobacterium sp. CCB-ST2H9]|uniref:DUF4236 domain-containing protein n=1 Tax=Photobacterium sp. CCB-ST2H9 TaxID=2912855 RepID=UPI0020057EAA|nr:DUF4236 domain-containing protein [Photobacterium sp. CCB-ST2H9]UTM60477.1 DUF4236 domain-containing protein [Photobacterium sp. CCB-ST2H9]